MSALLSIGTALAADEVAAPVAGDEFLEYLGSWDGDDSDWQVVARVEPASADDTRPAARTPRDLPKDPVNEGEAEIAQE